MCEVALLRMEYGQMQYNVPYVQYVIQIHYACRLSILRRRYSEFYALHLVLEKKLPILPQVKKNKLFIQNSHLNASNS